MVRIYELPDEAVKDLAEDLSTKVPRLRPGTAEFELGETFDLWMLGRTQLMSGEQEMIKLAINTHRYHHQIFVGGRPMLIARSIKKDKHWQVVSLHLSNLAHDIDEATTWIDANVNGGVYMRLLSIPAHYIHAFWLTSDRRDDQFYFAQFPSSFHELQKGRLYATADFLSLLQALPFEEGRRA